MISAFQAERMMFVVNRDFSDHQSRWSCLSARDICSPLANIGFVGMALLDAHCWAMIASTAPLDAAGA